MTTSKRYVLDTNVLVSALLFADSKPAQVFFQVLASATIITSFPALQELTAVLQRKKFDRYIPLADREAFITTFALTAEVVDITESIQACRDPKDDKFLEIAVNGTADCVITGDQDLLSLHPFRGIAILTPDTVLPQLLSAA